MILLIEPPSAGCSNDQVSPASVVNESVLKKVKEEVYDRTFQYLGGILERAGSSWDDVIDITTYHVDIDDSMPALAAVKNRYVKGPFPAWTAIDIDRLYAPDGLVEIKITARVTPEG